MGDVRETSLNPLPAMGGGLLLHSLACVSDTIHTKALAYIRGMKVEKNPGGSKPSRGEPLRLVQHRTIRSR